MKLMMINGSRRPKGCTFTALSLIAAELNEAGIETEIFQAGPEVLKGNTKEAVRQAVELMAGSDGLVIGAPVYYASPSGEALMFLDRLFWEGGDVLEQKPCACITSARRAGTTATLDALHKYPMNREMPIVTSVYWNMIHGNTPEEVMQDEEGVFIMKTLGRNMAWMLRAIEAGRAAGIEPPVIGEKPRTNFIR